MADEDEIYNINEFEDDNFDEVEDEIVENIQIEESIMSYDEIISKNNNKKKKTVPFLNKFEKARLLGVRIQQLSSGAQPKIQTNGLNSIIEIVEEELKQRKIPLIIKRNLPNGDSEEWKLEEFEKV